MERDYTEEKTTQKTKKDYIERKYIKEILYGKVLLYTKKNYTERDYT